MLTYYCSNCSTWYVIKHKKICLKYLHIYYYLHDYSTIVDYNTITQNEQIYYHHMFYARVGKDAYKTENNLVRQC